MMRTLLLQRLAFACLGTMVVCAFAKVPAQAGRARSSDDASWTKRYAALCDDQPCPAFISPPHNGDLQSDPRFPTLLKRSLPQRESWWVDGYEGSAPVATLVQTFLGIPKQVTLDSDRYLVATGCVPHVCSVTGMLWIDTGATPATVIFVGEDSVGFANGNSEHHAYLYSSRELASTYYGKRPIGILDPNFLKHLAAWRKDSVSPDDDQYMLLATIVWPNGRTHDELWSDLFPKTASPDSHPGASK